MGGGGRVGRRAGASALLDLVFLFLVADRVLLYWLFLAFPLPFRRLLRPRGSMGARRHAGCTLRRWDDSKWQLACLVGHVGSSWHPPPPPAQACRCWVVDPEGPPPPLQKRAARGSAVRKKTGATAKETNVLWNNTRGCEPPARTPRGGVDLPAAAPANPPRADPSTCAIVGAPQALPRWRGANATSSPHLPPPRPYTCDAQPLPSHVTPAALCSPPPVGRPRPCRSASLHKAGHSSGCSEIADKVAVRRQRRADTSHRPSTDVQYTRENQAGGSAPTAESIEHIHTQPWEAWQRSSALLSATLSMTTALRRRQPEHKCATPSTSSAGRPHPDWSPPPPTTPQPSPHAAHLRYQHHSPRSTTRRGRTTLHTLPPPSIPLPLFRQSSQRTSQTRAPTRGHPPQHPPAGRPPQHRQGSCAR